jgi:urocanate hydratase
MTERAEDLQLETLRAFTSLCSLKENWGGALIVACGLSGRGEAFSIASNIAGAGFLAVESRPEVCRAAVRSGACDFVVNSVDEALRILKNEIRKHKAVSVALSFDQAAAMEELAIRGVQPEMFAAFGEPASAAAAAAEQFRAHGALVARFDSTSPSDLDTAAELEKFTMEQGLKSVAFLFLSGEQQRAREAELLQIVPEGDPRRRWFTAAPRFFHRERPHRRLGYLTLAEMDALGATSVSGEQITPPQP